MREAPRIDRVRPDDRSRNVSVGMIDHHDRRRTGRAVLVLIGALGLCACSSLKPSDFAGATPSFDPEAYFDGHVLTTGVMENRSGAPVDRFTVDNVGHRENHELVLVQQIVMDGSPKQRTWHLHRVGANHYEATGTDIVGVAHGESFGNVFHLEWTLATDPGNSLKDVSMSQWMYLQPDGRTMINRTTISKFGVILVELTEGFTKAS